MKITMFGLCFLVMCGVSSYAQSTTGNNNTSEEQELINLSNGIGSTFDTVKELCQHSAVLEGFSIKGGVEKDGILFVMEGEKEKQARLEVRKWLQKIKMIK